MSCLGTVALGVQSGCDALKKVGGLDRRVWLGTVDDLASVVYTANKNSITAITFKTDKGLVLYTGKVDKNNANTAIEVGENVNVRNQTVNVFLGVDTDQQLATLDALIDTDRLFVISETRSGQLEVYGLNRTNFDSFGLKVTAYVDNTGTLINDSTLTNITLSGGLTNLKMYYAPLATLATNVAALNLLTIDPVDGVEA